jgi:peptidoglycan hydrolase-like protein with peptidoglycan-binding domain
MSRVSRTSDITPGFVVSIAAVLLIALVLVIAGRDTSTAPASTDEDAAAEETAEQTATLIPEQSTAAITSEAVMALQRDLTELGYYTGAIDGVYATATFEAVKALQTDLGVQPVDGKYGPVTHDALAEAKGGAATAFATEVQTMLSTLGYYTGAIDGIYGAGTAEAVKAFQTDAGLTADGIVGPDTLEALVKAVQAADASAESTPTS